MMELRTVAVGLVLALSLLAPGLAAGQQSKEQQGCINFLNKGFVKMSATHFKAFAKCTLAYAKDQTAQDPAVCVENSEKVNALYEKMIDAEASKCAMPPTIGPTSAGDELGGVLAQTYYLVGELVGTPFATNLVKCSDIPVDDGCKCQNTVLKTSAKLLDFYLKSFNKCTKSGLKATGAEQIVDSAGLLACLTDPAKLDPKTKLPKLIEKSKSAIAKGCSAAVTNPLPNSFDCGGKTGDALATCLDAQARCYACHLLNGADNIYPYASCDTFDDGAENSSCHGV